MLNILEQLLHLIDQCIYPSHKKVMLTVKKEIISFRMDITFWLAILLLIATMLSRHVGRILPLNLNVPAGSEGSSEISGLPGSD